MIKIMTMANKSVEEITDEEQNKEIRVKVKDKIIFAQNYIEAVLLDDSLMSNDLIKV